MLKTLLLVAAAFAAASPSFAQAPTSPTAPAAAAATTSTAPTPEQHAERRTRYLSKELALDADQQARLQPILLAQRQQMAKIREQPSAGGRRKGMGQEMKAVQANYTEQIKAVLTPEQFSKFTKLKDEQRERMREQRQSEVK